MVNRKVSTVIPVHNGGDFVVEAVESALSQTCAPMEVIVVDDGSTDDTPVKLAAFGERIRTLRTANQGVATARNIGIREARGEFIAFLDADDSWTPRKLEIQMDLFERSPSLQAVIGDFQWIDAKIGLLSMSGIRLKYPVFRTYGLTVESIFPTAADGVGIGGTESTGDPSSGGRQGDIFAFLFLGNFVNTSSVVARKTALSAAGGFDPRIRTEEDYDLWLKLSKNTPCGYIDAPLVITRRHGAQLTQLARMEDIGRNSLEIVIKNSGEAARTLPPRLVRRRICEKRRSLALVLMGKQKTSEARKLFMTNLISGSPSIKDAACLAMSFIPMTALYAVRRVMRDYRVESWFRT